MSEKVRVVKTETAALGGDAGDDTEYYAPLNPLEDAIEAARYYLQVDNLGGSVDSTTYIDRVVNDLRFTDPNAGTVLLQEILTTNGRFKKPVKAASTANLTLSGTQTIDAISCGVGDRVLVKNQSSGAENGIYLVASGAWTRALDADSTAEFPTGVLIFVEQGTTNGDTFWVLTNDSAITVGTTAQTYIQVGLSNNSVTDAVLRDSIARSVIGRAANSTGDPGDIQGAGANTFLNDNGTTLAFRSVTTLPGDFNLTGIASITLSGNQNDWAVGASVTGVYADPNGSDRNVTGIATPAEGRVLIVRNKGSANKITLQHLNGSSASANQIRSMTGADIALQPNMAAHLIYNVADTKWWVLYVSSAPATAAPANIAGAASLGTGFTKYALEDHVHTIGANIVADAMIRQSVALSVLGRSANSTGNIADISAAAASGAVLRESGSTIGFGQIATAGITDANVTYAKIQNGGARSVPGRSANSAGVMADISGGGTSTIKQYLSDDGTTLAFRSITSLDDKLTFNNASTTSLNADSNNLDVFGTTHVYMRLTPNANRIITGITNGSDGRLGIIQNTSSSFTITLSHESGSSTAANRIISPTGADVIIQALSCAWVLYDNNQQRWVVINVLGLGAATPAAVAAAAVVGTALKMSREDHVHTIGANVVANSMLRQGTARTVIGRSANSTGDVADIAGAGFFSFLSDDGSTLAFRSFTRYVFLAADFDDPNNSDWPITVAAELTQDSANNAIGVRRFDDTTEEGVSLHAITPLLATNIKFTFVWRAQTAPGAGTFKVQPSIRVREFPHQAAVESWAETDFDPNNFTVPNSTQWQTTTETISLSTLSMVAGRPFQIELTRQGADADDNLTGDWVVQMVMLEIY